MLNGLLMRTHLIVIPLLILLAGGCAETYATSEPAYWTLYGRVVSVHEGVVQEQANPAGGAVAGAVIGGTLGTLLGGRGLGTLLGATGGAALGADASRGSYVGHVFDVTIHFDDGSTRVFGYRNRLPFLPGDDVVWTERGLFRR